MANVKVIIIAFIAVIEFSMVYGDDIQPYSQAYFYYGCAKRSRAYCDKVCKMHLARQGGVCYSTSMAKDQCICFGMDEDITYFLKDMEKQ
nr:venom lipolysis activating peptide beta subunit isoform X2 [Androctonus crassicauda]